MKTILTVAILLLASIGVHAETYQSEFTGGYASGTGSFSYQPPSDYVPPTDPGVPPPSTPEPVGFSANEDYDGWQVGGRLYLDSVDTSQGPLALAPFLTRANHLGFSYSDQETDSGAELDEWRLDTRIVINDLVLEGEYGQANADLFGVDTDADLWRAAVGYYVAQNTQIRGTYELVDSDNGSKSDRYAIDITHVQSLDSGATWSANALVGWVDEDSDDGTDINVLIDWYFNNNVSLGTELTFNSRDIAGDTVIYELHGDYFINDYVSLRLSYFDQDYDEADITTDGFLFQVLYRR